MGASAPPVPSEAGNSELMQCRPCFVTLHKRGELRGCIGQMNPARPLQEAVLQNAQSAALRDTRFPTVRPEEVDDLDVEISVLSPASRLRGNSPEEILRQIEPLKHGVLFQHSGRTSTFLPQVWRSLPDKVDFMERLALKAGLPRGAWKESQAQISVYEVDSFEAKSAS